MAKKSPPDSAESSAFQEGLDAFDRGEAAPDPTIEEITAAELAFQRELERKQLEREREAELAAAAHRQARPAVQTEKEAEREQLRRNRRSVEIGQAVADRFLQAIGGPRFAKGPR